MDPAPARHSQHQFRTRVDRHDARTAGVARRARTVGRSAGRAHAASGGSSRRIRRSRTSSRPTRRWRAAIVAVVTASRSLFTALERDPAAVRMLRSEALHATVDFAREARALVPSDDPARALRRWKRQQIVRIAGRDLLGIADLRDVVAELATLARACLGVAVDVAAPSTRLAVIGMGKLGGGELNYASDVDVLFVHDGDQEEAEHAARSVLAMMTRPSPDGIVFRTDADLRPEGRAGALSRTLDSFTAYWERWARNWELQALLKATPVAGDDGARRRVHGARAAVRVAGRPRPRRGARSARDESAHGGAAPPARDLGPRAEARARRHPRHRVRGPAPATRARPARSVGARRVRPWRRWSNSPPAAT